MIIDGIHDYSPSVKDYRDVKLILGHVSMISANNEIWIFCLGHL